MKILLSIAAFLGFLVAFSLAMIRQAAKRRLRVIRAQLDAHRRGDHEAELKIAEGLRINESEPPDYLFFHGSACYQLGWLPQAERALRRSLEFQSDPKLKTVCRNLLGRVLMAAQRWGEAEECFRECIAERPSRGGGYRALAEMLLRRGGAPQQALDQARSAVAADRAAKPPRSRWGNEVNALNLSESLALLAWALAENRAESGEVRKALDEAFALCPPDNKPICAELHFFAGHACAALGESSESIGHFQTASETDPAGAYGRLAQQVMTAPSGI